MHKALKMNLKDFEDSMQVAAAVSCSANYMATRNVKDFKQSPVKALSPSDLLRLLAY